MKRLKVVFVSNSQYKEWEPGDVGYVDGYCRGGDDVPYAVIVTKDRIVMAPLYAIRVVEEREVM